jgi:spore maturation protein SpmB
MAEGKQWAPTGDILTDFLNGARKGFNNALFNQTPAFVMAFILIKVLNMSGLMLLIEKAFSPLMGIFGLPGATGVLIITGWLSSPGAVAMMPDLVASGYIGGKEIVVLIPMIYAIGQQLQWVGRILAPIRTPARLYIPIIIIGWITFFFIGFAGRFFNMILGF